MFRYGLLLAVSTLPVLAHASDLGKTYVRLFEAQKDIAETGDTMGQYYLGEMYELGLGTKQDKRLALFWYSKAAENGNLHAKRRIEALKRAETETAAPAEKQTVKPTNGETEESGPQAVQKARRTHKPAVARRSASKAREKENDTPDEVARRRAAAKAALERLKEIARDPFE